MYMYIVSIQTFNAHIASISPACVPPAQIGLVSRFQPSHPNGFQLAVSICAIPIVLTGVTLVRSRARGQNPSALEELNCMITGQSGCGHSQFKSHLGQLSFS